MEQLLKEINVNSMKNIILLPFVIMFCLSCKSQKNNEFEFNSIDHEVLRVFLGKMKDYSYVYKYFFNQNLVSNFIGKFKYHQDFQSNADSICKFSNEINKRKFYCPLADEFSFFEYSLNENDFNHLYYVYSKEGKIKIIEIDSISTRKPLRKHLIVGHNEVSSDDIPNVISHLNRKLGSRYYSSSVAKSAATNEDGPVS